MSCHSKIKSQLSSWLFLFFMNGEPDEKLGLCDDPQKKGRLPMEYIKFIKLTGEEMETIIGISGRTIKFWCEYDIKTFVGAFHDNSSIPEKVMNGKTIETINKEEAAQLLLKIAKATSETNASRYSKEIEEVIQKFNEQAKLPF